MKSNTVIKILLDVAMTILYVLLVFGMDLGLFFHEVAGIGIGALFAIHLALNKQMWRGLKKQVLSRKASKVKTILFLSDIFLPFGMLIVILTGVLISIELFNFPVGVYRMLLFNIHNILSYVCLGILLVHILCHTKYLICVVKQLSGKLGTPEVKKGFRRFAAGATLAIVLYGVTYGAFHSGDKLEGLVTIKNSQSSETLQDSSATQETTGEPPLPGSDAATPADTPDPKAEAVIGTNPAPAQPLGQAESATGNTVINKPAENQVDSTATIVPSQPKAENIPTLEAFLGNLHCNLCSKYCVLTNLRCSKGFGELEKAEAAYYATYPSAAKN